MVKMAKHPITSHCLFDHFTKEGSTHKKMTEYVELSYYLHTTHHQILCFLHYYNVRQHMHAGPIRILPLDYVYRFIQPRCRMECLFPLNCCNNI